MIAMASRKCGKTFPLRYGSYSCERPRGHAGLHRKYAVKCPGGHPGFTFSDAELRRVKQEHDEV